MSDCRSKIVRDSCIKCALKHLSQAMVISIERLKGYPLFIYLVSGHMAEAEDELAVDHNKWALEIQKERKNLEMDHGYQVPFENLITGLHKYDHDLSETQLSEVSGE